MAEHRPRMVDIANRLGISVNAVSLALAGRPGVSAETRRAVESVAKELRYRAAGRRVAQGGRIAIVFNELLLHPPATLFFGPVLLHLQRALAQRSYSLTVFGISDREEADLHLPFETPAPFQAIVLVAGFSSAYVRALQALAPVIWIDHYDPLVPCDKVLTDNCLGAALAVQHLVESGHQAIGFLGDIGHSPSYVERWQGYGLALEHFRADRVDAWEWTTADERFESVQAFWDGLRTYPTAWFCANDILAANLLRAVQARGGVVPDDVSIVGFDDLQLAQTTSPTLTTVHVPVDQLAHRAVDLMARRLDRQEEPKELLRIAPTLIVRESSRTLAPAERRETPSLTLPL